MAEKLREGYTTGTSAAAAAKAAMLFLLCGERVEQMDTPLPPGGRYVVPIHGIEPENGGVRATVIKDGGDDPDATHGHRIQAFVRFSPAKQNAVTLSGGIGVGMVTLPGLPVAVGEPAINPEPRKQIRAAVLEAMEQAGATGHAKVVIEVPSGEKIATKTMNARLGIVGGISILGTRGTVKPYSHESYEATIRQALDVARAQGITQVGLSTGGRTEKLLQNDLPDLPKLAFVQFADFFQAALSLATEREFSEIYIGCYFGKLVKMAHGFGYTHAHGADIDFSRLARWIREAGVSKEICEQAKQSITARHVLELMQDDPVKDWAVDYIAEKALASARKFAGPLPKIQLRVYDFNGERLCVIP